MWRNPHVAMILNKDFDDVVLNSVYLASCFYSF